MQLKLSFLVSFVCLVTSLPAKAEYYIQDNHGGQIGSFISQVITAGATKEKVHISGECLSACTLILALPRDRLCFEPGTRFGFHAAWTPDESGRPITSKDGTKALMEMYPAVIRGWIRVHGGLTRRLKYLAGNELAALYPRCTERRALFATPVFTAGDAAPNHPTAAQ